MARAINSHLGSRVESELENPSHGGPFCRGEPQGGFESGSILLYLAEKFDAFLPKDPRKKTEAISWLMWQMGSAPYLGGGLGHFYAYAPYKMEYPINRFAMEVKRQLHVLDTHLADKEYIVGDEISVADFAIMPWYGAVAKVWRMMLPSSYLCMNMSMSFGGPIC